MVLAVPLQGERGQEQTSSAWVRVADLLGEQEQSDLLPSR